MAIKRNRSAEMFLRPYELERKQDYIDRCLKDRRIKSEYTPIKARIAAEREWSRAKSRSVVSVTTVEGEFLMFDFK